jgi:hypothetical protein
MVEVQVMPKKSPMSLPDSTLNNDDLARSDDELVVSYRAMAEDTEREAEALEWAEALIKDGAES